MVSVSLLSKPGRISSLINSQFFCFIFLFINKSLSYDKKSMNYLILIFLSTISLAGPRGIASFEEKVTSQSFKACIHSLANAPTTPLYPKTYFQDLAGEESFTLRCHQEDTKDFMRWVFVTDTEYKALTLPMYYYKINYRDGGTDSTELPRNVIHFKYNKKDLYLEMGFVDSATIRTPAELPMVARETMSSLTKIQNEYVKKYEDWLRAKGAIKSIEVYPMDAQELDYVQSCLDKKLRAILDTYLTNKFGKIIPAYGTIVNDSRNYQSLDQTSRQRYQKPFEDIELEVLEDVDKLHPACQGVITETTTKASFEKSFGKNRAPYETLRRVFFGN